MKSLENYKDPSVHDIIQFITNTTYCLYMQPSDRKDYEFYIDMEPFNKKKLTVKIDRSMSKVYFNAKTNKCGIELVDNHFIDDITSSKYQLEGYVLSHLNLNFTFHRHVWIHFHLPDVFYTYVDMYVNKDGLLFEFMNKFIFAVPVANNQGLNFGTFPNGRFVIQDNYLFRSEAMEATMEYYDKFSLNKLFHTEIESDFSTIHNQLYQKTIELVANVYKYIDDDDKYNMKLVLTNVKSSVKGMEHDEVTEENCIKLIARVIHQVSYIHSVDHLYLYYTLQNKKVNWYYLNMWQKPNHKQVYLFNSFVFDIGLSPGFNLMTDLKFNDSRLNKLFSSYLKKTEHIVNQFKYKLHGQVHCISNKDISHTLSY